MYQNYQYTLATLQNKFPKSKITILDPIVEIIVKFISGKNTVLSEYGNINTKKRLSCFLGQIAYETDSFHTLKEYASGEDYENKKDLGNTHPGDGKRFKGRGYIQLTGRSNYEAMALEFKMPLDKFTEELETNPQLALKVSATWWKDHHLNKFAEGMNITKITKTINGGLTGLKERSNYSRFFRDIIL